MNMSFRERFIGEPSKTSNGWYAPSTIGTPGIVQQVDYSVFKQTPEEKLEASIAKTIFKKAMKKQFNTTKVKPKPYARFTT